MSLPVAAVKPASTVNVTPSNQVIGIAQPAFGRARRYRS
jgi:hypothetical protein